LPETHTTPRAESRWRASTMANRAAIGPRSQPEHRGPRLQRRSTEPVRPTATPAGISGSGRGDSRAVISKDGTSRRRPIRVRCRTPSYGEWHASHPKAMPAAPTTATFRKAGAPLPRSRGNARHRVSRPRCAAHPSADHARVDALAPTAVLPCRAGERERSQPRLSRHPWHEGGPARHHRTRRSSPRGCVVAVAEKHPPRIDRLRLPLRPSPESEGEERVEAGPPPHAV